MDVSSTIAEAKKALRARLRREIAAISPEECLESDRALFDRFLSLPQVQAADTMFLFWGIPGREPETERQVRELLGKEPSHSLNPDECVAMGAAVQGALLQGGGKLAGASGAAALAFVPAVSYDRRGYRLGFGGGYYDRWLEDFSGRTAGLCRGVLLQEQVPIEGHDARVEVVLTEQEAIWIQT